MNWKRFSLFTLSCFLAFFIIIFNVGIIRATDSKTFPIAPFDPNSLQKLSRDNFKPPSERTRVSTHKILVTSADYTSALSEGSKHLVKLQADITEDNAGNGAIDVDLEDGGWDWAIDSTITAHSGSASPTNTYGATAGGVLGTYITLGGKAYPPSLSTYTALEDAYAGMLADLAIDSGADFPFLVRLSEKTGDSKYANLAKARYDAKNALWGGSKAWADSIFAGRSGQGLQNGIIPWDVNQLAVGAAKLNDYFPGQGYDADADTFAQSIYDDIYNNNPGYFDETDTTEWWWTLGIAGALEAFTVSGTHPTERDQLATTLLNYQNDGITKTPKGAWDWNNTYTGGDYQTTAYVIMALMAYGTAQAKSACIEGVNWLVGDQRANGGWYWDGYNEYTEEVGEVVWAISLLVPSEVWVDDDYNSSTPGWGYDHFDKIQDGINGVVPGGTVNVYSGNYTEQLTIQKDLTLEGIASSPKPKIIAPAVRAPAFQIAESGRWWDPVIFIGLKAGAGTANVTVKGFEIDGLNLGTAANTFVAVLARNANPGMLRDCDIHNFHNPGNSDRGSGIMIYGNSNFTARSNTVSSFSKNGITANGDFGPSVDPIVAIDSNTVTGDGYITTVAQNGIQVGFGAGGTVHANTISNIGWIWSGTGTQWVSAGILPAVLNTPGPSVNCTDNIITDVQVGIYYSDGTGNAIGNSYTMTNSDGLGSYAYYSGILACDPLANAPIPKASPIEDKGTAEGTGRLIAGKVAAILTYDVSNNILTGDSKNSSEGIYIYNWSGAAHTLVATASHNTVKRFNYGLVSDSDSSTVNVTVNDNTIACNTVTGIYLANGTTASLLYNNKLFGNAQNAKDDGVPPNAWDNGSVGNFWDDWASNSGYPTQYNVSGTAGSTDHHPQAPTVVWVDDNWAGTPCGDLVGGHMFGFDAFATIQDGIDHVGGSTVNVLAGTYEEQIEITKPLILKGAGASSTTIKSPATLTKFFVTGPNNYPIVYVHDASGVTISDFTVDGAGRGNANYRFIGIGYRNAGGTVSSCTIKDVRNTPIDGSQHGVGLYAFADDGTARTLDVVANTIYGFQKNGMALSGANLTVLAKGNNVTGAGPVNFIAQNGIQLGINATGVIDSNAVSGFAYTPYTWTSTGILVYSASGSISVTRNSVLESMVGIWYINSQGTVSSNSVSNTLAGMGSTPFWWGIVADPGKGNSKQPPVAGYDMGLISLKPETALKSVASLTTTVNRNEMNGGGNGTGIEADALGTETLNFSASENSTTNWAAGFVLYKDPGATLNGAVSGNSIAGNSFGLANQTGVLQDASANWWGSATGPKVASNSGGAGDSVSSDVDYTPWLDSGADMQLGTPGFQGDFSVLNVFAGSPQTGSTGRIQEGIDLVSGSTVKVLAGIYDENLVIHKPLSLLGAGQSLVTVYPAISDIGQPNPQDPPSFRGSQMCVVQATNVTIDGFTFDGDSPILTPPGTIDARNGIITNYTAGDWSNLKVQNCTVKNVYLRGIYAAAQNPNNLTGVDFNHNTISNVKGWSMQSAAMMLWGSSGDAKHNTISDASLGIFYHWYSDGKIDSNSVTTSEVCLGTNSNDAATSISYNTMTNSDEGIQTVYILAPVNVTFNSITACTSGVVLYGGGSAQNNVWDNSITGLGYYSTYGFWCSTDPYGVLSANLKRNTIKDNFYGMVLNEAHGNNAALLSVLIGGASADRNFIYNNINYELLLEYCNDNQTATYNYWGKSSYAQIEEEIYHKVDQPDLGLVTFNPGILHGDVNLDGQLSVADVVYLVNYLFKGGPAPQLFIVADVNRDGKLTISDAVYLINYLFKGGPAPKVLVSESLKPGMGRPLVEKPKLIKPVDLHSVEK
jgi:hypothetical protein